MNPDVSIAIIAFIGGIIGSAIGVFATYYKEVQKNKALLKDMKEIRNNFESIRGKFDVIVNKQTRLYDIRVDIYKKLYESLISLNRSLYRLDIDSIDDKDLNASNNILNAIRIYHQNNSIFLPKKLDAHLQIFIEEIENIYCDYQDYSLNSFTSDPDLKTRSKALRQKALNKIDEDVPELLGLIKNEVQKLING